MLQMSLSNVIYLLLWCYDCLYITAALQQSNIFINGFWIGMSYKLECLFMRLQEHCQVVAWQVDICIEFMYLLLKYSSGKSNGRLLRQSCG